MPNVKIPYGDPGQASFEEIATWSNDILLSGAEPEIATFPMKYKYNTILAQFAVVGLSSSGDITAAIKDVTPAIGVLTQSVVQTLAGSVPVFYSGCFNPDVLVWDASYATDADKAAAFSGAPTPTQILIRKRGL